MPTVRFRAREFDCAHGDVLRDVLLAGDETPHNSASGSLNCRGLGSCGTCAVSVSGPVSDSTRRERLRLRVPPHDPASGLRLACQTRILGDVTVEKHAGFWGQHVDDEGDGVDGDDDGE
ncbi:2Fe-2S iron-sulfur cluster-binding protein [Salinigranum halophilum]|jgi:ferredoxin|uniref:2Fe-2S iron-sulfur cluster-binding protein n=1 Tax=Salinigranum halophilum TaxID=2565931 RepID=UPI0010A754F0|nr:2Fe-2S iron-sulfur cluster-binding protein [Salinigranum halophilum]